MPDFITRAVACRLIGGDDTPVDLSTLYRMVKRGRISAPVVVGLRAVRFDRAKLLKEIQQGKALEVAA